MARATKKAKAAKAAKTSPVEADRRQAEQEAQAAEAAAADETTPELDLVEPVAGYGLEGEPIYRRWAEAMLGGRTVFPPPQVPKAEADPREQERAQAEAEARWLWEKYGGGGDFATKDFEEWVRKEAKRLGFPDDFTPRAHRHYLGWLYAMRDRVAPGETLTANLARALLLVPQALSKADTVRLNRGDDPYRGALDDVRRWVGQVRHYVPALADEAAWLHRWVETGEPFAPGIAPTPEALHEVLKGQSAEHRTATILARRGAFRSWPHGADICPDVRAEVVAAAVAVAQRALLAQLEADLKQLRYVIPGRGRVEGARKGTKAAKEDHSDQRAKTSAEIRQAYAALKAEHPRWSHHQIVTHLCGMKDPKTGALKFPRPGLTPPTPYSRSGIENILSRRP